MCFWQLSSKHFCWGLTHVMQFGKHFDDYILHLSVGNHALSRTLYLHRIRTYSQSQKIWVPKRKKTTTRLRIHFFRSRMMRQAPRTCTHAQTERWSGSWSCWLALSPPYLEEFTPTFTQNCAKHLLSQYTYVPLPVQRQTDTPTLREKCSRVTWISILTKITSFNLQGQQTLHAQAAAIKIEPTPACKVGKEQAGTSSCTNSSGESFENNVNICLGQLFSNMKVFNHSCFVHIYVYSLTIDILCQQVPKVQMAAIRTTVSRMPACQVGKHKPR